MASNASGEPPSMAGAQRTLLAVGSTALLALVAHLLARRRRGSE